MGEGGEHSTPLALGSSCSPSKARPPLLCWRGTGFWQCLQTAGVHGPWGDGAPTDVYTGGCSCGQT